MKVLYLSHIMDYVHKINIIMSTVKARIVSSSGECIINSLCF